MIYKFIPPQLPRSIPCKIALVGEAPGDEEVITGKPFSGPGGKLLNGLLSLANIDREDCLVTNLFQEQLPNNDIRALLGNATERKSWTGYDLPPIGKLGWLRPEFAPALDRLSEEICLAAPNVIVPLGPVALWAFTGYSNIMSRRGAIHEASMVAPGRKLIPILHPQAILRQFKNYSVSSMDFLKVAREAEYPDIRTTPRELWLEPTHEDLVFFKRKYLDDADYISVDIETIPRYRMITCIGFAPNPNIGICIPFVDMRQPSKSYWTDFRAELAVWDIVREVLESDTPKIMQNGTYDSQWLFELLRIKSMNYSEDTRLLHHALYPELPKSLSFLGASYANERAWKENRIRHEEGEKRDD